MENKMVQTIVKHESIKVGNCNLEISLEFSQYNNMSVNIVQGRMYIYG